MYRRDGIAVDLLCGFLHLKSTAVFSTIHVDVDFALDSWWKLYATCEFIVCSYLHLWLLFIK